MKQLNPTYAVLYVPKNDMAPGAYGFCSYRDRVILIRDDLSLCIKRFVLAHERQHERDYTLNVTDQNQLWLEIKANVVGLYREPIGAVACLFKTIFSLERWAFYWRRIT